MSKNSIGDSGGAILSGLLVCVMLLVSRKLVM